MKNVSCTEIEGAMYGFPKVEFSNKFIADAEKLGKSADYMYCMEMVEETGVMTVPGSEYGQEPGSHHFRISNLMNPTERMVEILDKLDKFNANFHAKH